MLMAMMPGSSSDLYWPHEPARRHHPAEDEHEHHRLQERLEQQRNEVSPRDVRVAGEHRQKSTQIHSRRLRPV